MGYSLRYSSWGEERSLECKSLRHALFTAARWDMHDSGAAFMVYQGDCLVLDEERTTRATRLIGYPLANLLREQEKAATAELYARFEASHF